MMALLVFQINAVLTERSTVADKLETARDIQTQANSNVLPEVVRDASKHSGRVFEAWENLPLTESFKTSDFYAD